MIFNCNNNAASECIRVHMQRVSTFSTIILIITTIKIIIKCIKYDAFVLQIKKGWKKQQRDVIKIV